MNDQALKWLKAAPLPALVLGAYVYAYAVDQTATEADKNAAVAAEGKREQNRRLERMEDKIDALTNAVAVLIASKHDDKQAAPAPSPSPAPKKKENR